MFFLENLGLVNNQNRQIQRNPEENPDRIIEIQQGCIKNLIHIDKSKHNIHISHPWRDWKYLIFMLFDYFCLILGNLIQLIAFIVILAFDDSETTIMPLILIFFYFPVYLVLHWLIDTQRTNHLLMDSKTFIKKIVFNSREFYHDCTWGNLLVGDIILLHRNEVFPADILILDSENEYCLLQTELVDGKSSYSRKKPIKLTSVHKNSPFKGNLEEYKKILTGQFQYESPNPDLSTFHGTLKLKKDPISEELTINSLAFKGSTLSYSDWILGIVLYIGSETKISYHKKFLPTPCTPWSNQVFFYDKFLNRLNMMCVIMIIISCLFCLIRISSNNDYFHQIFQENSMEILFVNFILIIPTNIYILAHFLSVLYKYMLEKQYKGSLLITNPDKFSYLNQITHLILDKSPAIDPSQTQTVIHSLYLSKTKNFYLTPAAKKKEKEKEQTQIPTHLTVHPKNPNHHNNVSFNQMKVIELFKPDEHISSSMPHIQSKQKQDPKILLPRSDSFSLVIPEDGILSQIPQTQKIKLNLKDTDFSIYTPSHTFQGQGEAKMQVENSKDVETIMTLGQRKEKAHDSIITEEKSNNSNSKSQFGENLSPDFPRNLNGINDLSFNENIDKFGSLHEMFGNNNSIPPKYDEIFKALVLCHEARSKETEFSKESSKKYLNEFPLPDSNPLLEFIEGYQYKFLYQCTLLNNMIKCYNISINGKKLQYYILGSHSHNSFPSKRSHYKFSLLLKPAVTIQSSEGFDKFRDCVEDGPILYYRTNDPASIDMIDMDETEKELLKLKIEVLRSKGLRFVLFCQKKNLTDDEITDYLKHIKEPCDSSEPKNLGIENNCELLAVVAIKDKITRGLKPLINDFLTIENKVWLLSNDNEDSVLSTGFLLQILTKECELIRLETPEESCNINEAWIKIRAALNKLKKILMMEITSPGLGSSTGKMAPRKSVAVVGQSLGLFNSYKAKYNVIINGKTLELLSKDENLLSHFVFIVYFARGLVGYELTPQTKEYLLKIIKEKFPNKPVTMVLGDGYDDIRMMKVGDIGVEIKPNKNTMEKVVKIKSDTTQNQNNVMGLIDADISVNSLIILRELIRVKSLTFNKKIMTIIMCNYSSSFLFVLPLQIYTFFYGFLTGPLITPYLFIIKDVIVLNSLGILYFFWGEIYSLNILRTFVWTYKDGKLFIDKIYRIVFWRIFINSIIDSSVIIVFMLFASEFLQEGNFSLYEQFNILLYSAVYFMIFEKMTYFFSNPHIILVLTLVLAIIIYFVTALIAEHANINPLEMDIVQSIIYISKDAEMLLLLIYLIIYQQLRSYFNQNYFYKKFFSGYYGKIKQYLSNDVNYKNIKKINFGKFSKGNTNDFALKNISEAIRHIFKYKHMDILIQEMLNPNEINVNERGYHPLTLNFKEKELESQYLNQIKKFSIKKKKIISTLALSQYIILIIGLLILTYSKNEPEHLNLTLALTGYLFVLFINRILLNFKNHEFYYNFPRIFLPVFNIILNILCIIFSVGGNESFNSDITVYTLAVSMIFQSEYIEAFIHYFGISMALSVLFFGKVIGSSCIFSISQYEIPSFQASQKASMIIEGMTIIFYEIYCKYKKEQTYRNIFLNERAIKQENKKIGELLSILVPGFVKESLIQGVQTLSEDQGDVTLLFCDICNFDKMVKQENVGVIQILDKFYRMFDSFCLENDVQKIETVGKTYMACAGLKAVESTLQAIKNKNSTQRVINLALNMMSYAKKFTWGESEQIIIKIGIHYGPVMAGVIGYHKPQFSLIGDTVNTTSRVCSTGEESNITISKYAYDKILGNYKSLEFVEKRVEAKGKGEIITFQIKKKRKTGHNGHSTIISPGVLKPPKEHEEKVKIDNPTKDSSLASDMNNNDNNNNNNNELIKMAKHIRQNIKKTTMMMATKAVCTSPKHGPSNPLHRTQSPEKIYSRLTSHNNLKKKPIDDHNDNGSVDYAYKSAHINLGSVLDNKSEGILSNGFSFNRMDSALKGFFQDELNSTYEKKQSFKESFLKLNTGISRSDHGHSGGLNIVNYIESEHFKALLNSNDVVLDHVDKFEQFPGQHNQNDVIIRKSGSSNNPIINDDDFFDKLKVKENTLEILIFHEFWLTLKGSNPTVIKEFLDKQKEDNFNENMASMGIFNLVYLINTFQVILRKNDTNNFEYLLSLRSVLTVLNFISVFIMRKKYAETVFMRKLLLILMYLITTEILFEFVLTDYFAMENTLELILFVLISINYSYLSFIDNLLLCIYISFFLILHSAKQFHLEFFINLFCVIFCLILILHNLRVKILNVYKNFNTLRVNIVKKDQQNNLIVNLLPTHILEKFLRNPNQKLNLTDEFEDVTILFADIAGFTKYSSTVSPIQVVSVLKDLFTEFDKLCLDNCVYKLYTIGDCYVVLGIIDAEERDVEREALNVINMGFQMIEKIKEVKKRVSFHDIDMRIGIHTGRIIGGIIGTDIVRYDVYGKDVVIANKMESNGIEGNITISEKTKEVLLKAYPDYFLYAPHKEVHLQSFNNQIIKTFKVFDVRNES